MDLTKNKEIDLLREFLCKVPAEGYLASIFLDNGLAAEVENAIRNDFGFVHTHINKLEEDWQELQKALRAANDFHDSVQAHLAHAHGRLRAITDHWKKLRDEADSLSGLTNRIVRDCENKLEECRKYKECK